MNKQEQIKEMKKIIGNVKPFYVETIVEALYNAGYRKIDEFENCRKCPAWSGTDCTRNPYTEGCLDDKVNLKNEIKRLEKENEQLKAKLNVRLTCDFVKTAQKQAKIDVLNKVKERAVGLAAIETYHICNLIDDLLREYE